MHHHEATISFVHQIPPHTRKVPVVQSMSSIEVDEDAVLRLYGLSTLDPQRWEAVEGDDVANIELQGAGVTEDAGGRSREIEDPLGLYKTLKM